MRPDTCPWWALKDPFVGQVRAAHRWWKAGQLGPRGALPAALVDGIDVYESALNATLAHDMRKEREERERENERRAGAPTGWGPAATQRPITRRR